jgi:hypothetical protein
MGRPRSSQPAFPDALSGTRWLLWRGHGGERAFRGGAFLRFGPGDGDLGVIE